MNSESLERIDFDITSDLAQIYSYQDEYKQITREVMRGDIRNFNDDTKTIEVFSEFEWWRDIINMEKELLERYDNVMKRFNVQAKSSE